MRWYRRVGIQPCVRTCKLDHFSVVTSLHLFQYDFDTQFPRTPVWVNTDRREFGELYCNFVLHSAESCARSQLIWSETRTHFGILHNTSRNNPRSIAAVPQIEQSACLRLSDFVLTCERAAIQKAGANPGIRLGPSLGRRFFAGHEQRLVIGPLQRVRARGYQLRRIGT